MNQNSRLYKNFHVDLGEAICLHHVQIHKSEFYGAVHVILGRSSGAGKSSIADLLVGLYEPTEGAILVDGIDLNEYSMSSWRSRLGVVSQDTFIFNESILENIRYGKPDATEAQVKESA